MGPFRGDNVVILLFPARSIEDGVQEGGGARTRQRPRHRSDRRSPSSPAIVHPAIGADASNVPVAMDRLASSGRNRRPRIERNRGIAHKTAAPPG
jgi:hypothetical protein